MAKINSTIERWLNNNIKTNNSFFKKLVIYWPKIAGKELARYSIPHKIIVENEKLILQIYVYNGAVSLRLQSNLTLIKKNILFNIGYCELDEIKIIQKLADIN